MGGERKSLGRFVKKGETGCHAALNSRTDARPLFQHCPLFHCRFIALKSRTFVVKSRTTFAIKFVRDLSAKSTPMGDCGRGCLGRIPSTLPIAVYEALRVLSPNATSLFR